MIRGTTPKLKFNVPFDTDTVSELSIAFSQRGRLVMEKVKEDVESVSGGYLLSLTQADTLQFEDGANVEIQIRAKFADDSAIASQIVNTTVGRILRDGEI